MTLKVKGQGHVHNWGQTLKTHESPSHTYTIAMSSTKICMLSGLVSVMCTKIKYVCPTPRGWVGVISKYHESQFGHFQTSEKDSDVYYPIFMGSVNSMVTWPWMSKVKIMSQIEVKHKKHIKVPLTPTLSSTKLCMLSWLVPRMCTKICFFAPPQEVPGGHNKIPWIPIFALPGIRETFWYYITPIYGVSESMAETCNHENYVMARSVNALRWLLFLFLLF